MKSKSEVKISFWFQLPSYGGDLKYTVFYEIAAAPSSSDEPDVILMVTSNIIILNFDALNLALKSLHLY